MSDSKGSEDYRHDRRRNDSNRSLTPDSRTNYREATKYGERSPSLSSRGL